MTNLEITGIAKSSGPLTKRIFLGEDGGLISDGSACIMSAGTARRLRFGELADVAASIGSLEPHEAIALGRLRDDLPDEVTVTTQRRLANFGGSAGASLIARTGEFIAYASGRSALALVDVDTKGIPDAVKERVNRLGGFWDALVAVAPLLATAGRIVRRSTSSGLRRTDTGEALPSSNGVHIYISVCDGADIERFLRTLHARCWLHGLGWHGVGAAGQLLERSLVDRSVYAAERLVFEGAPVLVEPLAQDGALRQPVVFDGAPLDTVEACPPLRVVESAALKVRKAESADALSPARALERDAFITKRAEALAERIKAPVAHAKRIIERQCDGVLLPDVVLPWDDEEFSGCTVADVLEDPERFEGATLSDPVEGTAYGRGKAKIMRRTDGSPWINSFAHGRTVYELRFDLRAAQYAVSSAPSGQVVEVFLRVVTNGDLDSVEIETLRNTVADLTGTGKRALNATLKTAQAKKAAFSQAETKRQLAAERKDPRPQLAAPAPEAPWLPIMEALNDVLSASKALEPPMRDPDGIVTQVRVRHVPNMHALTSQSANEEESDGFSIPQPEQPLLTRLDEVSLAELIERHVDFVDRDLVSVHLSSAFVKHYLNRNDTALPIVSAIATLPLVTPDGTLLFQRGLDRARGIVFRVPSELMALMPKPEECTDTAIAEAMRFLTEDWLCDVSTDYVGRAVLVAAALTIVERSALPERPAFFVTAARRGGGKTTVLMMLMTAVTGVRPSAAAWSPIEEERRKSLFAYLLEGVPSIIWDNIPRGTQISCPHIEKSCTTAFYSDRRLGLSEMVAVGASAIHQFTGNNIGPRGDLASRSLEVRLEVDRADPENREFLHPDPIAWTMANRGRILRALYTILLGNPDLNPTSKMPPETRFKTWWHLVGSAVEHAVRQHTGDSIVRFRDLFLSQEDDDEEGAALVDALSALDRQWPSGGTFLAADLAKVMNESSPYIGDTEKERAATLRQFLFPTAPPGQTLTAKATGRRLRRHVGEPVLSGGRTLTLKNKVDPRTNALSYYVASR